MATNIEMNYYNGSSYISLRPMGNLSNMEGSLTADQIPNLDMSKITSGNLAGSRISGYVSNARYATSAGSASNSDKLEGYTYSQVISNASSSGGGYKTGSYTGTGTSNTTDTPTSITIQTGVSAYCFIIILPFINFPNRANTDRFIDGTFLFKFKDSRVTSIIYEQGGYMGNGNNFLSTAIINFSGNNVEINVRMPNSNNTNGSTYYTNGFNMSGKIYNWICLY